MKHGLLAVLAGVLLAGCATSNRTDTVSSRLTEEGLLALEVEDIERILVHPGADFATFTDIVIEPPTVTFRDGWQPVTTGSRLGASRADLEAAREQLASLFASAFQRGLLQNKRLRVVEEGAPGVLRITPVLTDVTLNNVGGASNAGGTMSRKHGSARVALTVHDVRTGTLIARLEDEGVLGASSAGFGVTGTNAGYTQFERLFETWGSFVGKAIMNISPEFDEAS